MVTRVLTHVQAARRGCSAGNAVVSRLPGVPPRSGLADSPWMSRRVKAFLGEGSRVPTYGPTIALAPPFPTVQYSEPCKCPHPISTSLKSREHTCSYEDCELLFTTEGMDCMLRTDKADATYCLYWPMVLLIVTIGPHLAYSECDRARV